MRISQMIVGSALYLIGALALVACEPEPETTIVVQPQPPSGYEVTTTGSGCRETATGQYVERSKCDPI